jgi:hypothetical protein
MKRTIIGILISMMVLNVGIAFANDTTGNGSPNAKKVYSLNIIGVTRDKKADMDDNNGHRIFVPLDGKAKIELIEGDDFTVLDANGTDGPAQFQLPNPGLDPYVIGNKGSADTMSDYSVYVRPLGKPGGWATITTCADIVESTFVNLLPKRFVGTLNEACYFGGLASVEQVGMEITMRDKGPSKFQNVTAELLTVVFEVEVDEDGDLTTTADTETIYVRVPIFDDSIENEYWEYDNDGLKILQVRFYEVETDVSANDSSYLQ